MALQQRKVLGKTTINHQTGGHLESQLVVQVYDDVTNEVISSKFVRTVIDPDDDVNAGTSGAGHISTAAWTASTRDKHQKRLAMETAKNELAIANSGLENAIAQGLPTPALEAIVAVKNNAHNAAIAAHDTAEQAYITSITVV